MSFSASPSDVERFIRWINDKFKKYSIAALQDASRRGRKDPSLIPVIQRLYPKYASDLVTLGAKPFPAISFSADPRQQGDSESVLGSLNPFDGMIIDKTLRMAGDRYLKFLKDTKRPVWDAPTFAFSGLHHEGSLSIDSRIGGFEDNLRSCHVLEFELLTRLGTRDEKTDLDSFVEHELPVTNYVHGLAGGDPVTNPLGRVPTIGISTCIIFNTGDGYSLLLGERSGNGVATGENMFHVVPSGLFQPVTDHWKEEFSVKHNVFREYLEELFKLEEVVHPPAVMSHKYFYRNPNLLFLRRLVDEGRARFETTGIAIDLLNLRPEILTLVLIESTDWYENHESGSRGLFPIRFNEEWKPSDKKSFRLANVVPVEGIGTKGLDATNLRAVGAAAIERGLIAMSRILKG